MAAVQEVPLSLSVCVRSCIHSGWVGGWVAGENGNKAISSIFQLEVAVKDKQLQGELGGSMWLNKQMDN